MTRKHAGFNTLLVSVALTGLAGCADSRLPLTAPTAIPATATPLMQTSDVAIGECLGAANDASCRSAAMSPLAEDPPGAPRNLQVQTVQTPSGAWHVTLTWEPAAGAPAALAFVIRPALVLVFPTS